MPAVYLFWLLYSDLVLLSYLFSHAIEGIHSLLVFVDGLALRLGVGNLECTRQMLSACSMVSRRSNMTWVARKSVAWVSSDFTISATVIDLRGALVQTSMSCEYIIHWIFSCSKDHTSKYWQKDWKIYSEKPRRWAVPRTSLFCLSHEMSIDCVRMPVTRFLLGERTARRWCPSLTMISKAWNVVLPVVMGGYGSRVLMRWRVVRGRPAFVRLLPFSCIASTSLSRSCILVYVSYHSFGTFITSSTVVAWNLSSLSLSKRMMFKRSFCFFGHTRRKCLKKSRLNTTAC